MARLRSLSLLLLSWVAALASGVFISGSSEDLKEKKKDGGEGFEETFSGVRAVRDLLHL